MKRSFCLLLTLLLPGCGSPATHFYTLAPIAPAAAPDAVSHGCEAAPIGIGQVRLPETLDRQSMVRVNSPERIDISGQDRWAAPLDGIIRHVLAEDLRDRLTQGQVLLPGDAPPQGGSAGLVISIQHFAGDTAGHVALMADWSLLDRHGTVTLTRSEAVSANAAAADTSAVVGAMSRAIGELADRIAATLQDCSSTKAKRLHAWRN